MESIKAKIKIEAKTAITLGIDTAGDHDIEVKPSQLTPDQREELAICISLRHSLTARITDPDLPSGYFYEEVDLLALAPLGNPEAAVPRLLDYRIFLRSKIKTDFEAAMDALGTYLSEHDPEAFWSPEDVVDRHTRWSLPLPDGHTFHSLKLMSEWPGIDGFREEVKERGMKYFTDDKDALLRLAKRGNRPTLTARFEQILTLHDEENNRARKEAQRLKTEREKAAEEKKRRETEERKQAEKEAAERRRQALAAWVAERGTPSQKERYAENLLPEEELLASLRQYLFAPLSEFDRYRKLKKDDFCECQYGNGDVSYEVEKAESVGPEAFEKVKAIRQAAKGIEGAEVTILAHTGTCSECEERITRLSARVQIPFAEDVFSREYAL